MGCHSRQSIWWSHTTDQGGCMKFAPVVLSSLLFAAAQAAAQAPAECPSLPASSGLQWQQQVLADLLVCRASTGDGREVLSLMLSARDPDIPLNRALRQEKAASAVNRFTGTSPISVASSRPAMPSAASAWSSWTRALRADFAVPGQRPGAGLAAAVGAGHEPDPVSRGRGALKVTGMTAWQHPRRIRLAGRPPGVARRRCRLLSTGHARRNPSELAFLEIDEGLHQFLPRVHHEGAMAHHRFAQRTAGNQDQPRAFTARREVQLLASAQHRQFLACNVARSVLLAHRQPALEHVGKALCPSGSVWSRPDQAPR